MTIARLEGEPVEVLGERTMTGSVYALPDGTMVAGMASGPVWVPTGEDPTTTAGWARLDLTLQATSDGAVVAAAHPGALELSAGTPTGTAADAQVTVASLISPEGKRSAIEWVGPLPAPRLEGARAIYEQVRPGVDMVVDATASGFEQFFVVHEAPVDGEPLSLPVVVTAEDSTVREGSDGALEVVGQDGEVVVRGPRPMMWDALADADRVHPVTKPWAPIAVESRIEVPDDMLEPLSPEAEVRPRERGQGTKAPIDPPGLDAKEPVRGPQAPLMTKQVPVARSVAAGRGGGALRMDLTPQPEFLTSSETVYPIVVDPELTIDGGFDTYVQSNSSADLSTSAELLMGTWNGGTTVARSFVNFNKTQVHGKDIHAARLYVANHHSYSCSPRNWQVWSTAPASTATRWSAQPRWSTHWATSSETKGFSSACDDGWVTADIRGLVQAWADVTYTTAGIALRAASETDSYAWKRFYSADAGAGVGPWVWVRYNTKPEQAGTPVVSGAKAGLDGVYWSKSTTPMLESLIKDADGDDVTATFQVLEGSTVRHSLVVKVKANSVAQVTVPSGVLVDGKTYGVRVATYDGQVSNGTWSPTTTFGVDTQDPLAPIVSSADYPNDNQWHKGPGEAGTFTLTLPAADATVTGYSWGLNKAPDAAQVVATTAGASKTLSVTPPKSGRHELQVQTVDRAGRLSGITKYAFHVGKAGILFPEEGAQVVRRVRMFVAAQPGLDYVQFQWRRGPDSPIITAAPVSHLSTSSGHAWTQQWQALPSGSAYTTWDIGQTLGFEPGPIQVRAQVSASASGTSPYDTQWVTLTVDPDADGAAATSVGPGSVNLLTGDHNLSVTDAEEFGLAVVRTASSRDTDSGIQLQEDRLSEAQQKATELPGFVPMNSGLSISTAQFHTGTTSLRIVPGASSLNTNTYASVGGDTGALRLGLRAGRTYRLSGWVFVPSSGTTVPTSTHAHAMKMALVTRVGTGSYTATTSAAPTAVNAWQRITFDATVPAGATEASVRLYNGFSASVGQAVFWDDVSVREIWSPFGPEWAMGTVDGATGTAYTHISQPYDDAVALHITGGGKIWFTSADGKKWWPQPGAGSLRLDATSSTTWRLTELDGTFTDFTKNPSTKDFPVTSSSGPVAAEGTASGARHIYDVGTLPGVSRLERIIAPIEPGVDNWPDNTQACTTATPARGCEVMQFTYATATTATSTSLGAYAGRLSEVSVWSWDASAATPAMVRTPVTAYRYDSTGRLREAYDPRIVMASGTALRNLYDYDTAGRLTVLTAPGEAPFTFTYGPGGAGRTGSGDWIDPSAGRLLTVSRKSLLPGSSTEWGPDNTTTVVYNVPLTRGAGGPYDLDPVTLATWDQQDGPTDATAVFGPQDPPSVTTATASSPGPDGYAPATVHYLNASGLEVNTASPASADTPVEGFIDTAEYDRFGNVVRTLDATNRLLALKKLPGAQDSLSTWGLQNRSSLELAQLLDSRSTYSADGLDLLTHVGPVQRLAVANDASQTRLLRPHAKNVYDQGKPDGVSYHLLTSTTSAGLDPDTAELVDPITTANRYSPVDGAPVLGGTSGWVHKQPTEVTVDVGHANSVSASVVYDDRGRVIRSSKAGSSGSDAATTLTIHYTAGHNPADASCGGKPEWAGQPCVTKVAGGITGHDPSRMAGALPVRRVAEYNLFGSPTHVVETVTGPVDGVSVTQTRTTITTYDVADRVTSVAMTGTGAGVGATVAETRSVYDTTTGDVVAVQSVDAAGNVTGQITKKLDALGRLVEYADANGAVTTTTYDRFGQPAKETQKQDGREIGSRTFTYDRAKERRGYLTSITDSVAGTIGATWGPDGQLLSQTLPGGVTLSITYDPARVPVERTYTRTSDGAPIWRDSVIENHRGQWVSHDSTTGTAQYTYDRLGRLTQVTDRQAVSDVCTTRAYGFGSARSNRTQFGVAVAGPGQACASATLATTATYDSADRLLSSSEGSQWTYDPLGRTTTMATGQGAVTNEFFVNDLIARQTQAGVSRVSWGLDPIQRLARHSTEQWVNGAWVSSVTKVSHFASDSDEPSWVSEDITLDSDVTRYVSGVEGDLAVSTSLTGDRELQLVDLHGDVVGTLPIADGAGHATWSGLVLSRTDEFGNPTPLSGAATPNGPPRYGWLGAAQRSGEALGGVILMGVRLYQASTGRFLSVDPVPGGSISAYDYCNADPVNCTDLGGTFSFKGLLKVVATVGEIASLVPGPIGAAAAGVSAVAYAAQGNTAKAIEMGVTAAAQLVGAGLAVRVAAKGINTARLAGSAPMRAAAKKLRSAGNRVGSMFKRTGGSCSIGNSFVPGTLVVMGDGTLRPIEELETGDLVLAGDPLTGEVSAEPVIAPITGTGTKHLIDIVTDAGIWTATAEHPIWVEGKGWTYAADLTTSDQLRGSTGGILLVRAMHDRGWLSGQTVHNLHIAGPHTYYIASSSGSVDALVHNAKFCSSPSESPVWRSMRTNGSLSARNGTTVKTTGRGKSAQHHTWDHTHGDIEVFNRRGAHLGSMHPSTGRMHKPAVRGRTIAV